MASSVAVKSPVASHFPQPDTSSRLASSPQPRRPHKAAVKDPKDPGTDPQSANGKRKQTKSRNGACLYYPASCIHYPPTIHHLSSTIHYPPSFIYHPLSTIHRSRRAC